MLLVSACAAQPISSKQIYSAFEIDDFPPSDRIFFDFDNAELQPHAVPTMKELADLFNADPDVVFVLEGHTDSRGPEDYNLALGCRRAEAAREAMIELGFPTERLQIVSYGEYRPAVRPTVLGETPDIWAQNRRVVFVTKDAAQGFVGPNCGKQ